MSHPLIAAKLYTQPWCILPEVHASICQQFHAHTGRAPRADADDPVGPEWHNPWTGEKGHYHPQVQAVGPVAMLEVRGVIGKHLSNMEMECGGYDIGLLEQQMEKIHNDPSISAVVIYFNTPGGIALGVESAAKSIRRCADSGKKIYGYTDYQCASAGYWLASACDELHAEGSAIVGSISTFCAGIDSSRMFEMEGLQLKLFRTGELKAIGHPGKAWTEAEEAFMQEKADTIDADFKGFVRARRGLPDESMNGGFWYAKHAPAGLVDSTSFDSLSALLETVYQSI